MKTCKYCQKVLVGSGEQRVGFHNQCKQEANKEFNISMHNLDRRKSLRAKIVSGGSTGLVQQKGRIRETNRYKKVGIKKEIKDALNMYGFDLVIMQIGSTYDAIEEHADYFHKEFGYRYNSAAVSYNVTGFPTQFLDKIKAKLIKKEVKFCIVDEVDEDPNRIIRKVTYPSDSGAFGLTFVGGDKKN